jgi:hypothetical protein
LKSREKAYLIFLFQKRFTKKQIMKKLFIDNERTFQRLQKKMSDLIKRQNDAKNKKAIENEKISDKKKI